MGATQKSTNFPSTCKNKERRKGETHNLMHKPPGLRQGKAPVEIHRKDAGVCGLAPLNGQHSSFSPRDLGSLVKPDVLSLEKLVVKSLLHANLSRAPRGSLYMCRRQATNFLTETTDRAKTPTPKLLQHAEKTNRKRKEVETRCTLDLHPLSQVAKLLYIDCAPLVEKKNSIGAREKTRFHHPLRACVTSRFPPIQINTQFPPPFVASPGKIAKQ